MSGLVLLCYPRNTPYPYESHLPLGIHCLGAALEAAGVEVAYFDERVEPVSAYRALLERRPRVVGFSVLGGYQIESALRLGGLARAVSPRSLLVWGGAAPTMMHEAFLEADCVDLVVRGEGEETFREVVLQALGGRPDWRSVAGLALRGGTTPARRPPPLDELPSPYEGAGARRLALYAAGRHARETAGFEASRGCRHACGFCYSPAFHGGLRLKSPARVRRELESLAALGVRDLDVYDDTLLDGDSGRIIELAEETRRLGLAWTANLRIESVDAELLRRLEASGCRWLYFGLEAGDDGTLERLAKGLAAAEVERGLELLRSSTLRAVYSVGVGYPFPGEDERASRALAFARDLSGRQPGAEVQVQSFVPLPGTPLYAAARRAGFRPPPDLRGWSRHDHFRTRAPWLRDPDLPRRLYLTTFWAYRYARHRPGGPLEALAFPLHLLSLWRARTGRMGLHAESALWNAAETLFRAARAAQWAWRTRCAA